MQTTPPKVRRRGNRKNWYTRQRNSKGALVWVSLHTSDKAAALQRVSRLESGEWTSAEPIKLEAALNAWLRIKVARLREATLKGLFSRKSHWLSYWGNVPVTALTTARLQAYLIHRHIQGLAATSLNQERVHLKTFFNWLHFEGYLTENPVMRVERFPEEEVFRKKDLSEGERATLLEECSPRIRDLVVVALETGLRLSTLLALELRHVVRCGKKGYWLQIEGKLMKGRRVYRAPLRLNASRTLLRLGESRPEGTLFLLRPDTVWREFNAATKRAGIKDMKFHGLRGAYINDLVRSGARLEVAQALADHRSIKTTRTYYVQIDDGSLIDAVKMEGPK